MTTKRGPLKTSASALKAGAAARESNQGTKDDFKTTGISIPVRDWQLLFDVASARRRSGASLASISAILVDLFHRHRAEFEAELQA